MKINNHGKEEEEEEDLHQWRHVISAGHFFVG
jgi:hypothetical protein